MSTITTNPNIDVNFDTQHDAQENVTNIQVHVSIRAAAQAAVDSSNIEGANGVRVSYPDGQGGRIVESFAGPDSEELFEKGPDGTRFERPLPSDAEVEVVRSARGAY